MKQSIMRQLNPSTCCWKTNQLYKTPSQKLFIYFKHSTFLINFVVFTIKNDLSCVTTKKD